MTKIAFPYIEDTIINIASGAGKIAYEGLSIYCASKFAVRRFTLSIAQEFDNSNVYVVNPA